MGTGCTGTSFVHSGAAGRKVSKNVQMSCFVIFFASSALGTSHKAT